MSLQAAVINLSANMAGVQLKNKIEADADHPNPYVVDLPPGHAGTLTTRTDNSHGVATMGAGHGLITGDVVDIRWAPGPSGIRFGMTTTVATNAVTVAGGAGANLPATTTVLVVTKQVTINTSVDGDAALLAIVLADYDDQNSVEQCHFDMQDAGEASICARTLDANRPKIYDLEDGQEANPFTGNDITVTRASNSSLTATATLYLLFHEDSTP